MTQGPYQSRAAGGDAGAPDGNAGGSEASRGDPGLIGRMVSGKYRIEKFLGGGAMGAVYKARFAALEKNVAVKVMHSAIAAEPSFVARFHREAKAASRLDHPNSMRVIDFGEEADGLLYIAMEYVEGRDLYRVIHEDWPVSNADIADILMQALAAIAVAHEMGVIHRDLKPENLMILRQKNDEGREAYLVKVCDFGIAKITEKEEEPGSIPKPGGQKLTTQGLVVGTPEYMSPEQAKGEKLDARSDIYSMGVILYQLITGRTPFIGDTALSVVLKHITEAPPAPSVHYAGVHKGLEAVTLKAIAKDRNERFQTARDMRNAIREALDGRPMPVPREAAAVTEVDMTAPPSADIAASTRAVPSARPALPASAVSGPAAPSHPTPLGTSAVTTGTAAAAPRKSRTGLIVGAAGAALLLGVGATAGPRLLRSAQLARTDEPAAPSASSTAPAVPTATATATASARSTRTSNVTAPAPSAVTAPSHVDPNAKPTKHGNARGPKATLDAPAAPAPADAHAEVPPSPPPATPAPDPAVPAPQASPVPPAAPAPAPVAPAPQAAAFNPQTCRATLGQPRSNGAAALKDLSLNGTAGAWTACARSALHERPSAPLQASVHLMFSDSRAFRGATCAGCPPQLASCIASTTGRTVAVTFKGGDVTGEPAYDVPVTFTCD